MFKMSISLSGEEMPLVDGLQFDEVGLIRSEYLFREAGLYPTETSALEIVTPYLNRVSANVDGTVWYRTLEVDTAEANTLEGVEEMIIEPDRLRGMRGIRRSMKFPVSFKSELKAVAKSDVNDIGIIVPFVSRLDEAEWAAQEIRKVIPRAKLACMVEIPSIIPVISSLPSLGYERIVVGCNDLGSLSMGTARAVLGASGIPFEFQKILECIQHSAELSNLECIAAGYLTLEMVDFLEQVGYSGVSVHYSDLTAVFNIPIHQLPEHKHLSNVKSLTRAAIEQFNEDQNVHQVIY